VENRNGLIADAMTTQADGRAERDAVLLTLHELTRKRNGRIMTGADKAYDTRDFVDTVRELGVTPHVARRHPGYAISLSKRWLVEKPFGRLKQIGPLKKVKLRGLAKWLDVRVQLRRLQPDPDSETAGAERAKEATDPTFAC
jgi:hypothetical protein